MSKIPVVAIIGRPNVGKSTLLNRLVGRKLAIVTSKPQTTRSRILGIASKPEAQLVYLDTPGIQEGRSVLESEMRRAVIGTLDEVDVILYMADASRLESEVDSEIAAALKDTKTPIILGLNKTDIANAEQIAYGLNAFNERLACAEFVPISAATGDQVDLLERAIVSHLPESPPLYPPDTVTTQDDAFLIAELCREKILNLARQEVPHCAAVLVEHQESEEDSDLLRVFARIIVERDSHKRILIGRRGEMIKRIGTQTRKDVESLLGARIYLDLLVSVRKDWRNDARTLRSLGYESS